MMSECYVGEIRMFTGNYAPEGWAYCDGSLLSISQNETLFVLLGTTYGGDGVNTFGLPDLRGRVPVHHGTNRSSGTNYLLGQLGGTENVTLISTQLPVHTHTVSANNSIGDSNTPQNNVWGTNEAGKSYVASTPSGTMNPAALTPVGGNLPHNNMMPFLTINFIIALVGVFPSQN